MKVFGQPIASMMILKAIFVEQSRKFLVAVGLFQVVGHDQDIVVDIYVEETFKCWQYICVTLSDGGYKSTESQVVVTYVERTDTRQYFAVMVVVACYMFVEPSLFEKVVEGYNGF